MNADFKINGIQIKRISDCTVLPNSYGNDFKDKKYTFVDLLKEIEKVEGIDVIRFVSPHPKDFTDALIDEIAASSKIAKQIHLPLQSGSTEILKAMNRKYTKEHYLNLIEKMMKQIIV